MPQKKSSIEKVLFIAYTFPPIPYGGTYRALRLCRGFAECEIECHVLTIKQYNDIPNDFCLLSKVPESIIVHRTPIIDPCRKYQAIKKRFAGKFWFKIVNKFVSFLLRFITFPDHMLLWAPFAVLKARKVIKEHGIKTVLVTSPPDSSQLVGWFLKKWMKIKWIADFRDPIYGNVAQVNLIDPVNPLDKLHKKLLIKYDRFIACSADTLVANTQTHAEQLQKKYNCKNVHVVRNSFDPTEFSNVTKNNYSAMTIAHIGSIYGKRNPDLLFSAIKQLASEYAPEHLQLQVIFLGLGGTALHEQIHQFGVEEYVKIEAQVPHHKAIESMSRAHLLLLIKATGKWSKGQIPGKFFEYIGARKPVLCIGPKDSEVATLIHDYNLGFVVEDDVSEMLTILKHFYTSYLEYRSTITLNDEQITPFSSKRMVKKMSEILR